MGNKIVILDGFVANSGDLKWDGLEKLGELTVYERTAPEQIIERCKGAKAVFTNKVVMDAEIIKALPELKFIGVLATGYNNVDISAARESGITVCNVPAYSTDSVAQLVFALLLAITNKVESYSQSVNAGDWANCIDFSYRLAPIQELAGMTIGVIGYGNIGSKVGEIAHAFGMNVQTTSSRQLPEYVKRVDKETIFATSDVISLNSALTPETRHIINKESIALMRPETIIINTSRGPLIDEQALAEALRKGNVAALGTDVLCQEPPRDGSPLIGAPNCLITPHIAWQSTQARRRLMAISAANLEAFLNGKPINVVS